MRQFFSLSFVFPRLRSFHFFGISVQTKTQRSGRSLQAPPLHSSDNIQPVLLYFYDPAVAKVTALKDLKLNDDRVTDSSCIYLTKTTRKTAFSLGKNLERHQLPSEAGVGGEIWSGFLTKCNFITRKRIKS